MTRSAREDPNSERIDRWLWAARFFKTRALAAAAIKGGKVQWNGVRVKPARMLSIGDKLAISRAGERIEIEVLKLGTRRGPASVVAGWYRESEVSHQRREAAAETRRIERMARPSFGKRPDKRARRRMRRLTRRGDSG